jgi:8-amino-7-oxononanoate synthase
VNGRVARRGDAAYSRAVSRTEPGEDELAALEAAGRRRGRRRVDGPQGPRVILDGREVANFSSNDYLGLASHPALRDAAHDAIARWGVGAGSSRLIVGNGEAHEALEASVAAWLGRPAARLFNSGYAANTGVIPALAGVDDVVLSDELNHASIIDGCRLSRARVMVYRHCDLGHLEELLRAAGGRRRVVVSESLFSMDGDRVDVAALAAVARAHDAMTIVDDAHAVGVLGAQGRGLAVAADVVIGTFGKALGSFGAFVAGTEAVAELLWNRARPLVFSTGLPPVVAAAARAAVDLVQTPAGDAMRQDVAVRVGRLGAASHIMPVVVGDDRLVMALTERLLERGIYVQGIRPPTVPEGTARLRVSISAAQPLADVDRLATELAAMDVPRETRTAR